MGVTVCRQKGNGRWSGAWGLAAIWESGRFRAQHSGDIQRARGNWSDSERAAEGALGAREP